MQLNCLSLGKVAFCVNHGFVLFNSSLFYPLGAGLLVFSTTVAAAEAPFTYRVVLRADSSVSSLLEQYLEIFKLKDSPRNSPEQLSRSLEFLPQAVADLLATQGYFNTKTVSEMKTEQGQTVVYIQVELGEPVVIHGAKLNVSGAVQDNPERLAVLESRFQERSDAIIGTSFTQSEWDDLKKRTLASFMARDYPASVMSSSEAIIDPELKTAQLNITMDSGPAYVYGPVQIHGLQRYPEKLVRDLVDLPEGAPYRRSQLLNLQTELQNLPHFASALVDVSLPADAPFIAPVQIDVQESPLNKVSTNLGYSTNTGAQAGVDYRYLNLFDRGWIFNSKLEIKQKEQLFDIAVAIPKVSSGWEHNGYINYASSDIEGLQSDNYRIGVSRNWIERRQEHYISLQYLAERRQISNGSSDRPHSLTLNYKTIVRDLDSLKDPRHGYMLQAEIGGASEQVMSDVSFVRAYGNAIHYNKIGQEGILALRLELGQTFTSSAIGVPTEWLFRAGGMGSVRGYDYQSLGVDIDGSVVPGRVLATSSIEYQHLVYKDWRAAIFYDYGGAGADWRTLNPVRGAGIGARWLSPVGQIGADIAYGIDKSQFRFQFAMGLAF
ncbi:outer membrane protein assembly factor [Deefgea piscis]|uniref:Outer membrane protein assembly factor n=1 Tax=Deefgea piscis TaxID=2739061 RepID=A0A6M8SR09_9NEIS|nr:autotransporter assembly complex family protein [Deefgea piscis]QKJ67763.1 outer membrane protein assembly factor [Deefgea piscis]